MRRKKVCGCLAAAVVCVSGLAGTTKAQQETFYVDALSGVDALPGGTLTAPFKSIRFAADNADVSKMTTINVIGRFDTIFGVPAVHNDGIEDWSGSISGLPKAIEVKPQTKIVWDEFHSDTFPVTMGGGKVPVMLTGWDGTLLGGQNYTAFSVRTDMGVINNADVILENLRLSHFTTGVQIWATSGFVNAIRPTLQGLIMNQCYRGIWIVSQSGMGISPQVLDCKFLNENAAYNDGTVAPNLPLTYAHVANHSNGGWAHGTFQNCLFRSGTAPSGSTLPAPQVFYGFLNEVLGGEANPLLVECQMRGNSNYYSSGYGMGYQGMLYGVYLKANGGRSNMRISSCWIGTCGMDGVKMVAENQGGAPADPEESGWPAPDPSKFSKPVVSATTLWKNGKVASLFPSPPPDAGHGIATRTRSFGLLKPDIFNSIPGGGSTNYPNLGISENYFAGVYIHSEAFEIISTSPVTGEMRYTSNDTVVRDSHVFDNQHDGVSVLFLHGSGAAAIHRNRIYHNDDNGSVSLSIARWARTRPLI